MLKKFISTAAFIGILAMGVGAQAQPLPIYPDPPEPQNNPSYELYIEPDNPAADSAAGPSLSFAECKVFPWGYQRTPSNPALGTRRQIDFGGVGSCAGTDQVITSVTVRLYSYSPATRTWTLRASCPIAQQTGQLLIVSQTPCSYLPSAAGLYSVTMTINWKFRGVAVTRPTAGSHLFEVA